MSHRKSLENSRKYGLFGGGFNFDCVGDVWQSDETCLDRRLIVDRADIDTAGSSRATVSLEVGATPEDSVDSKGQTVVVSRAQTTSRASLTRSISDDPRPGREAHARDRAQIVDDRIASRDRDYGEQRDFDRAAKDCGRCEEDHRRERHDRVDQ